MIWLLLTSLALAEPAPAFGPEPPPEVVSTEVQPSLEQLLAAAATEPVAPVRQPVVPQASAELPELGSALPWGLALLGAAATLLWMRRRTSTTGALLGPGRVVEQRLAVVARQSLGPQGSLLLVEAEAGDGRTRRLLLSTSTSGTPRLVADLGAEAIGALPVTAPPPLPERAPALQPAAQPAPRRTARAFQLPEEPELTPSQGRSLVDELLAERRGYGARRSA